MDEKKHLAIYTILLLITAVIAPMTYKAAKTRYTGQQTQGYQAINHSAHHGGTVDTQKY